jgi:hypothetical protein
VGIDSMLLCVECVRGVGVRFVSELPLLSPPKCSVCVGAITGCSLSRKGRLIGRKLSRSVQLFDYALWVIHRFKNSIEGFGRICMRKVALRDANRARRAKAMSRTHDHPMHARRNLAKFAVGLLPSAEQSWKASLSF